jgi:hypothetical protein
MSTLNNILKEIKEIPVDRLEELSQFIHALNPKSKKSEKVRKKFLSFGVCFRDMTEKDYSDFSGHTKNLRSKLFDRKIKL